MLGKLGSLLLQLKSKSEQISRHMSCVRMEGDQTTLEVAACLGPQTESIRVTEEEQRGLVEPVKHVGRKALLLQVLGTIAAGWCQFNVGSILVLSGAILPQLTNANTSDLYFDEDNAAFFSSSPNIGGIAGCLIAGMMMVLLGQRVTMLVVLPTCLASWLTIAFAKTILVVQVIRIIQGVCVGILTATPPAYVTEIADEKYRGTLDGMMALSRGVGIFLPFGLGAASMSWRHLSLVCGIVLGIPPFLGLLFFPNSPRWLASNGRYEAAEKALRFFRGQEKDITSEMEDIKITVENNKIRPTLKSQLLQLRDWALLKRFLILSFSIFAAECTGYMVMFSYALNIFESVTEGLDPSMCTVILGVFRSFTSVCYVLIIDRINRRKGLLVSFVISAVSMLCMGVYYYIDFEVKASGLLISLRFMPLTCILVHIFFTCFGISMVFLMKLETLPLSFRSLGSGIVDSFAFLSMFVVVQTFPYMNIIIKPYGTFWVYAGWCLVAAFVSVTFLPETRGQTLEVIELSSRTQSRGWGKVVVPSGDDRADLSKKHIKSAL